jgi:hypothetical protein
MDIKKHAESADLGWGSLYYDVIPSLINRFNLKTMAEIGVAFAGHLEAILTNTKIEKSYAIDPYLLFDSSTDSFSFENQNYTQANYDELFLFAKTRLDVFGDRVSFIKDTSVNASKSIMENSLDIVFIDGEHTFEALKDDIQNWVPKVKKGGLISGHDYGHGNFPDVKRFIDEWVNENNYELNVEKGYVWWVIKK